MSELKDSAPSVDGEPEKPKTHPCGCAVQERCKAADGDDGLLDAASALAFVDPPKGPIALIAVAIAMGTASAGYPIFAGIVAFLLFMAGAAGLFFAYCSVYVAESKKVRNTHAAILAGLTSLLWAGALYAAIWSAGTALAAARKSNSPSSVSVVPADAGNRVEAPGINVALTWAPREAQTTTMQNVFPGPPRPPRPAKSAVERPARVTCPDTTAAKPFNGCRPGMSCAQ